MTSKRLAISSLFGVLVLLLGAGCSGGSGSNNDSGSAGDSGNPGGGDSGNPGGGDGGGGTDAGGGSQPDGANCNFGADCQSTFCVAHICCNSVCGACGICSTGTCTNSATGSPGSPSCTPYLCSGYSASCPSTCTADVNCITGDYCSSGGLCLPRAANGTPCTTANQCVSGQCVGSICCNSACGPCGSCASGTCTPTAAGSPGVPSCAPYVCDGTAISCPNSCTGNANCAAGDFCVNNSCGTSKPNGSACSAGSECNSGNCVGNICCNSACGACGTCATGSCTNLPSGSAGTPSCAPYVCSGVAPICPNACTADVNCQVGDYCNGTACVPQLVDGTACTASDQCRSGVCTTFYRDADADGFGDPNTALRQCGTTVPAGYVTNNGDCCDSDANAHPGQAAYFTTADACGSFDYDCSGTADEEWQGTAVGCTNSGACAQGTQQCNPGTAGWQGGVVPGCGASGTWFIGTCQQGKTTCCAASQLCGNGSGCNCGNFCGTANTQSKTQACH